MIFKKVESVIIHSIGYDSLSENLGVVMNKSSDQVYVYHKFPIDEYIRFINSESKGRFLIYEIKGKYKFIKTSKSVEEFNFE